MEAPQINPKELSDESLADLVEWIGGKGRSASDVAALMSAKTGKKFTRQMVGRWLARNPEQRQQPSHGHAILLRKCVEELSRKEKRKTKKQP